LTQSALVDLKSAASTLESIDLGGDDLRATIVETTLKPDQQVGGLVPGDE